MSGWMDDSSEECVMLSYNMADRVWKNSSSQSPMTEVLWGAESEPCPLSGAGGGGEIWRNAKVKNPLGLS